jgi:hypothetical protein
MNKSTDPTAEIKGSLGMLTPSLARAACGFIPGNRRHGVRRSVHLKCSVVRQEDWRLLGDLTVDLSPDGMLVLSDERTDEGSELFVSFQVTEPPLWFDTPATVTRIVEGRRRGDQGRALGVRFQSLPSVSRLILRGLLCKLPQSEALREPPPEFDAQGERVNYADAVRRILAQ